MSESNDGSLLRLAQEICVRKNWTFAGRAGKGAFKETFKVVRQDGVTVALKVYGRGSHTKRTDREVSALERLNHANLPSFISLETIDTEDQKVVFSTEEFLDGGTLSDRISKALLPPNQVFELGAQLIQALMYIAELKLVHRDIKPDNIMFRSGSDAPVLVDFGLVRDLEKESLTATWAGRGPGTPLYAPAEQLNNEKNLIDWRSDQFSLGVVLTICGFGKHPYACDKDAQNETVTRVEQREEPAAAFRVWAESVGLPVLLRMVQPWPVQRFSSLDGLVHAWHNQSTGSK